ncbi:MAG: hypothetical protein JW969_02770 [Spirochaetales bacterium]|nr:hypothetical protein [Spirochaetales bacterium]
MYKILVPEKVDIPCLKKKMIESYGELTVEDHTLDNDELIFRLKKDRYFAMMINSAYFKITNDILYAGKDTLKMISMNATGFDNIDVEAASRYNILVCNVPDYATNAVAEMVFSMILALTRKLKSLEKMLRNGQWQHARAFKGMELSGKTLGVIGFGKTGKKVCQLARFFGMRVLVQSNKLEIYDDYEFVDLDYLLRQSDFVSLHIPYRKDTNLYLDGDRLRKMKEGAILINTARGKVLDELVLVDLLKNGKIAGAGLDVYREEPMYGEKLHNSIFSPELEEKVILTPHIAFSTETAIRRLYDIWCDNVIAFLSGNPKNVVNPCYELSCMDIRKN